LRVIASYKCAILVFGLDWEGAMRLLPVLLGIVSIGATVIASKEAQAQTIWGSLTLALKSGETVELGQLYYVVGCRSLLTGTPEAEILEGPPQVSVSVRQEMVLPRQQRCANRVQGGKLMITAREIEDPSHTNLTVRITYKTKDGDRKLSQVYNLHLLP
jgi:hypothetical protein